MCWPAAAGYDDGRSRNCRLPYDDSPLDPGHAERMRELSGVTVVKTETIPCTPSEFLEFVLDIEGYAKVDDKIAPVLWSRREGDVVQFACLPKIAGLRLPKVVQTMRLTSGERIDIGLNPPPANRLAHAVARFEASVACRAVPGGTEVTRSLAFRFAPGFRWLLEPLFRRRLPEEVRVELARARQHFTADVRPDAGE
jgi:hypothetical protein